jgi:hypothetical protein
VRITEIGAHASVDQLEDGRCRVSVRPWWSSTRPEPGAASLLRQPLATIEIPVESDRPVPRDVLSHDVSELVLDHECWTSVVPDDDERRALWRGIQWD